MNSYRTGEPIEYAKGGGNYGIYMTGTFPMTTPNSGNGAGGDRSGHPDDISPDGADGIVVIRYPRSMCMTE